MDSYPPGGFLSLFQNTSSQAQAISNGTPQQPINVGDDNNGGNCPRTEKRLLWTKDAWLNNSNDPIQSNYKKNDQYWKDVAAVYNSTTPKNRARLVKQVKDRFARVKKRVAWFYDARDERPPGGKQAKEQRKRKIKDQDCIVDLEVELTKFVDAQNAANEGRKEMLETQRRVSSENLEARKLVCLAAKDHKESVMLETYRSLMMQDTSGMPEDVRSEHVLALKCFREKLFGKTD
ncbi:hypothetical protein BRADI_1g14556v3 [Brachypodium distachyon]|uniref:Uncharacterized protein n=1 Tax=Brachypodium distachyon TaxID=15368 RepID=A0A0Q3J8H9_BRADI|nr:hypothetical protein BRADI_1g14556v3 [Brachypodium distachyon]